MPRRLAAHNAGYALAVSGLLGLSVDGEHRYVVVAQLIVARSR